MALCLLLPVRADTPPAPRTILVLFDTLTADDLRDPALPHLRALAQSGHVGLMNTAVAGPKTDTAAVLTLALGAQAPAEPTDEEIYLSQSEWVEGAPASVVFTRRTGIVPTALSINPQSTIRNPQSPEVLVHLGIASLRRRGLNDRLVGAALARAGKMGALLVCGNADTDRPGRRAALFVLDANGIGPQSAIRNPQSAIGGEGEALALARWVLAQKASVIVHLGDGARVESARPHLTPAEYARARRAALNELDAFLAAVYPHPRPLSLGGRGEEVRVLLVSPRPPANGSGDWDRLTPVVLAGAGVTRGLLTSATTRTPGLIANVDIAPTLLQWLDVPIPATMTGHPLAFAPSADPLGEVARLDRVVTVNAHALVPVFVLLGVCAFVIVFGGLAALWKRPSAAPYFAFGVLCLMNMPLALLLVVFLAPGSITALAAGTLGLMLLCSGVQVFRYSGVPVTSSPLQRVSFLTCLVILVDALFGQPLVRFSLFSAYQLQGIRFYGIGNEYMGVLIGLTLLWVFLTRLSAVWAALVFIGVAFVIGFPRLGANAGGLVVTAAAFGSGWTILRGQRATWGTAALWTLLGLWLAFGFAALEGSLSGGAPSHLGGALRAAGARGYGYLLEIITRKLLMNARLSLHPATLMTLGGIAALGVLARGTLRARVEALFAQHPDWARGLPAAGFGALVAFLFKDSGTIAALFLFGAFLVSGLYLLFADSRRKPGEEDAASRAPN